MRLRTENRDKWTYRLLLLGMACCLAAIFIGSLLIGMGDAHGYLYIAVNFVTMGFQLWIRRRVLARMEHI